MSPLDRNHVPKGGDLDLSLFRYVSVLITVPPLQITNVVVVSTPKTMKVGFEGWNVFTGRPRPNYLTGFWSNGTTRRLF